MEQRAELLALGQAIRRARERHGWTRDELALAAGVTDQTIMRVELGRNSVHIDRLWNIADALETPLSQLISEAEVSTDGDS